MPEAKKKAAKKTAKKEEVIESTEEAEAVTEEQTPADEVTEVEESTEDERAELERLRKENAALAAKNQAAEKAARKKRLIPVRAIARGYYGQIREEGDVFGIESEADMGSWMEPYDRSHKAEKAADPVDLTPAGDNTGDESVI